jgi:hypothetical protein
VSAFGAAGACVDVSVSEMSASVVVSALYREVCGSNPRCIDADVQCFATIEMRKRRRQCSCHDDELLSTSLIVQLHCSVRYSLTWLTRTVISVLQSSSEITTLQLYIIALSC